MIRPVISVGSEAPGFELPALVDGEHRRVALEEYMGEDVVILAFYPGDFNPACEAESDLDELDLFTMQKDVSVLGISPDTLYSHAAFADAYDLHIPLLSDTRREAAERYDVTFEDDVGQQLSERAVFVVDHDGEIAYAWSTRDVEELPAVEAIKDAIADTGGDDTAFARYRVGHAHYVEGRRTFTSAMHSFRDSDWMIAQSDFRRSREEFEEAADHFDSAVRFVDDPDFETHYDMAQQKATALWQAADWLAESASEYSSGSGAEGQKLRDDAEHPLGTARDLGEPVDPEEWPPEPDAENEHETILPDEEADEAALAVDIDEEVAADEAEAVAEREESDGEETDEGNIDDEELEQIEAELAASQPDDPVGEDLEEEPTSMVDAPPEPEDAGDIKGEVDEDDIAEVAAEIAESDAAAEADDPVSGERADDDLLAEGDSETAEPDVTGDPLDDRAADDETDPAADDETDPLDDATGGDEADPLEPAGDETATDETTDSLEGGGTPAADPHADLAQGSGGMPASVSDSLEPDPEPGEDLPDEEPQGASDEDLADIPTTEDLEDEADGDEEGGDDADPEY